MKCRDYTTVPLIITRRMSDVSSDVTPAPQGYCPTCVPCILFTAHCQFVGIAAARDWIHKPTVDTSAAGVPTSGATTCLKTTVTSQLSPCFVVSVASSQHRDLSIAVVGTRVPGTMLQPCTLIPGTVSYPTGEVIAPVCQLQLACCSCVRAPGDASGCSWPGPAHPSHPAHLSTAVATAA